MKNKRFYLYSFILAMVVIVFACSKSSGGSTTTPPVVTPPVVVVPATNDMDCWLTMADQSVLLQKQTAILSFGTVSNSNAFIDVDSTQIFQTIDGFGYTLTSGSASLINGLATADKSSLLQELFGTTSSSIGVSYLRLSIGASDLSASVYSYDDVPTGSTDPTLAKFSLAPDSVLVSLLKQIVLINPNIKIIATPWSAPVWMKDNNNSMAGGLQTQYYGAYAQYFVKYVQQMKAQGIIIDAVTPQNEPLNATNNPSLVMAAEQQRDFIKNNLGPAFAAANITTKIICYDHNCDKPSYPATVLDDAAASAFVNGSAFHLYLGDISTMGAIHNSYPTKNVYFTEQYTASTGQFAGDLDWALKNVVIGSMRNWSKNALEWNLANDANYGPHTIGGCNNCKGALTISSGISRNVAYYIIAHASKFVPMNSVRIASNISGSLNNVAFKTPDGKKVMIVENDATTVGSFNIRFNGKWVPTSLPAGAVATYIW